MGTDCSACMHASSTNYTPSIEVVLIDWCRIIAGTQHNQMASGSFTETAKEICSLFMRRTTHNTASLHMQLSGTEYASTKQNTWQWRLFSLCLIDRSFCTWFALRRRLGVKQATCLSPAVLYSTDRSVPRLAWHSPGNVASLDRSLISLRTDPKSQWRRMEGVATGTQRARVTRVPTKRKSGWLLRERGSWSMHGWIFPLIRFILPCTPINVGANCWFSTNIHMMYAYDLKNRWSIYRNNTVSCYRN